MEQALEAAGKCKLRQEFRIRFPREYRFAVNHRLLDEICKNLPVMHNLSERCIYAYEFPDRHVYVGLTCNIERRKREHQYESNSAVYIYSHESGLNPHFHLRHGYSRPTPATSSARVIGLPASSRALAIAAL